MYSMETVLENDQLFKDRFCSNATLHHLGDVPVEGLRETVKRIHKASGFRAAGTAKYWTPDGSEQSVVTFGRPTIAGSMQGFRFGLTTDVRTPDKPDGQNLFLWVPVSAVRLIADQHDHLDPRFISSWLPWRDHKRQKYRAMPIPMYANGNCLSLSEFVSGSHGQLKLSELLALLGNQLNLRREVKEAFSKITNNLGLSPDAITPRATEIMKNSRRSS